MNPATRYRVNHPHVVHDASDGETVVIHRGTGACYSLRGTAAMLWRSLARGASPRELCEFLGASYAADRTTLCASMSEFVAELVRQDLLVERSVGPDVAALPTAPAVRDDLFEPPRIDRYDELKNRIKER